MKNEISKKWQKTRKNENYAWLELSIFLGLQFVANFPPNAAEGVRRKSTCKLKKEKFFSESFP